MAYSAPSTISTGDLITASTWNADVVANPIAIYAGAMSVTSQAVGDILYASSTTQLGRVGIGSANKVLTSSGSAPQWSTQIANAALPTNIDVGGTLDVTGDTTLDGELKVSGTGPHGIGFAPVDYVRLAIAGNYTSGGSSTSLYGMWHASALTGHADDSAGISAMRLDCSAVTAGNATLVSQLNVNEPQITVGSGTVTNSASVYVAGAATEATNNYALWVDAGATQLDGTLDVGGAATLSSTLAVVGDVVFNDAGADKDFRVESDDDTHALVVIGSSDCVGIGESDPSAKFVVSGTGGTAGSLAGFDTSAEKIAILQAGGASHTDRKGNVYIYGTNAGSNDSVAFLSGASASSDMLFATRRADGVGAVNLHLSSGGTNINGAGMTFNAETAAANTLDDYEEGTFTPVLTGTTSASGQGYDTQSGIYTKVGDMVYINIYIDLNAKGSISGFLKITGLPFTNAGHAAPLTVSAQQVAALSPRQVTGPVYGSSAFLYLFLQKQSVATSDVQMDVNDINDSSILNFSGCYKV